MASHGLAGAHHAQRHSLAGTFDSRACSRLAARRRPRKHPHPSPSVLRSPSRAGPCAGSSAKTVSSSTTASPTRPPRPGTAAGLRRAPVEPWEGVRDASVPGPKCMQPSGQGGSFYGEADFETSEDCLVLNVWTRAAHEGEGLPVMVWIHGGALVTGAGSDYPGELLSSKGVVLVTANYRLGPFGFVALPELSAEHPRGVSGNQGFRDQVAAPRVGAGQRRPVRRRSRQRHDLRRVRRRAQHVGAAGEPARERSLPSGHRAERRRVPADDLPRPDDLLRAVRGVARRSIRGPRSPARTATAPWRACARCPPTTSSRCT